jgi:hypothetical protein
MKLPNAQKAVIDRGKITDYLLNPTHPDNGGKAEFFTRLGFSSERWEILATALKNLAEAAEITAVAESAHGKKYVIAGKLQSPGGKTALVQTIWIVDKEQDAARLVTAYPSKQSI